MWRHTIRLLAPDTSCNSILLGVSVGGVADYADTAGLSALRIRPIASLWFGFMPRMLLRVAPLLLASLSFYSSST